jgi:hypothetical protein
VSLDPPSSEPQPGSGTPPEPDASPADPGVATAEAAVARLGDLPSRPVAEHVEEYEAVHRALQDALATIDEG